MDDGQHRAGIFGKRLLEARPGGDVKVIDGFIQQQEGAALRHQQGQFQAGAFAITKASRRAQRVVAAEQVEVKEVARPRSG